MNYESRYRNLPMVEWQLIPQPDFWEVVVQRAEDMDCSAAEAVYELVQSVHPDMLLPHPHPLMRVYSYRPGEDVGPETVT